MMEAMERVLAEVAGERVSQDGMWGGQEHAPPVWLTILQEEVGEAARAVLENEAAKYRTELVHVAAVAVAAIECVDRGKWPADSVTALQAEVARLREERWLPPDERADECPDCRGRGKEWIEGPEPHLSGYANHPCPRCKGSSHYVDWEDPRDVVWVSEWLIEHGEGGEGEKDAKQDLTTAQTTLAELERVMTTRREGEKDGSD